MSAAGSNFKCSFDFMLPFYIGKIYNASLVNIKYFVDVNFKGSRPPPLLKTQPPLPMS
jgi:hypothetical protein